MGFARGGSNPPLLIIFLQLSCIFYASSCVLSRSNLTQDRIFLVGCT